MSRAKPKAMTTRIERLPLAELELLELNARFMRHETFQQLVENVRRDGCLTSVPFAVWNPKKKRFKVLSGNHRVQAAIEAGVVEADVMVSDDKLSEQQQIAIQLSHNALAGEDDPALLKELYDRLDNVDWRTYSGLDDKVLELLEEVGGASLTEARLDWRTVAILFLPEELERARAALEDALGSISGDEVWLAGKPDYDRLLDGLADVSAAYGIKNQATAFAILLDVFEQNRQDLADGWREEAEQRKTRWVPLSSVLGSDRVPTATAAALRQAIDKLVGAGEVPADKPWLALERLAKPE